MKRNRPEGAADVYVILPGGFAEKPENGLVISVLRRVHVLADRGLKIDIVSFPFAFDFARRSSRVLADFKLSSNVRFRNVYADLVDFNHGAPCLDPLPSGSGWSIEEDSTDARVRRVYFEGKYERFAYTGLDGRAIFADVLIGGKRSRREWYAPNGCVNKIGSPDVNVGGVISDMGACR